MKPPLLDCSWAAASWQGARDNAHRLGEALTLAEKLAWLEEAEQVVLSFGKRSASPDAAQAAALDAPSGVSARRR